MRLAEYINRILGYKGRDSTTKLRHLTTQSLNHQILKFAGALITIDCAGLSYMDFGRVYFGINLWHSVPRVVFTFNISNPNKIYIFENLMA